MMKFVCLFLIIIINNFYCGWCESKLRKGHGEPIGSHRPSDGKIDILTSFPSPQSFWDKYMSIGKPCLFRGAAIQYPAIIKWTNDYLKENYGDLEVKLEHKYEKGETPIGSKGVGRDTIRSFLESYLNEPKYIVSQLPDPMSKEIYVLPFLTCGSFKERLLEANLWLSSGGTKSLLHKDADNAINCLLNGTKEWLLIHPKYTKYIPVAEGDKGYGGFATLNVEKVNLQKYPKFQHVRYNHVTMKPGDCLFLPKSYWHQVNSFGIQNLAVSVLFSRLEEFSNKGCEKAENLKYVPLAESGMVWTYPGHGPQTLGNMDPFELSENLLGLFDGLGKMHLTAEDLENMFPDSDEDDDGNITDFEKERKALGQTLVKIFDKQNKSYVTEEDFKSASVQQLKDAANAIDPDPANTDEYEHFLFSPDTIAKVIKKSFDSNHQLTKRLLLENYMKIGGSESMGSRIYTHLSLGSSDSESVNMATVKRNLEQIFEQFSKRRPADKSGDFYRKNLNDDLEIMRKGRVDTDEDLNDMLISDEDFSDVNNDGYPDHEPIYQPEDQTPYEQEYEYFTQKNIQQRHEQGTDNEDSGKLKKPVHYLDDMEDIVDDTEDMVDEDLDEYPDHEPIYQPADQEEAYDENEQDESVKSFNRDEL